MRLLFLFTLAACGGTASDGSVEGRKFNGNITWGQVTQQVTRVVIEESVNVCQNKSAAGGRRNTIVIELSLWNGEQLIPANTPGVYTIESNLCKTTDGKILSDCGLSGKVVPAGARYAIVSYTRDADVAANQALAGNVRVSAVSIANGGAVSGDYELFLDTGDRLAGTFAGSLCEI